jgi:hypothetical protein
MGEIQYICYLLKNSKEQYCIYYVLQHFPPLQIVPTLTFIYFIKVTHKIEISCKTLHLHQ